jgi:hypothetical protein
MGGTLEPSWIERFMDISSLRSFYRNRMEYRMEDDAELKSWIQAEIRTEI